MSKSKSFAKLELSIFLKLNPDLSDFAPLIIELVDKFGQSGQSGGSAPYNAVRISNIVKKLCMQEPICPITGIDDEWCEVSDGIKQNKRCSALFINGNDRSHYLDAITWKTQTGSTWTGSAFLSDKTRIKSSQYVKSFPFEPKTFVIDVIEVEIKKDDWEFYVKNESDLDQVFEYYYHPKWFRDETIGKILE